MKPLCFVLMPFGRKLDDQGRQIAFDAVYREMIAPAIEDAGLEPIRADEETIGGGIHKPMFERLLLCEYAIADLTTANPNVYYELGVRHAVRPRSTLLVFCDGTRLPFDIAPLRGIPYRIDGDGLPLEPREHAARLAERLRSVRADHADDSPLFQLVEGLPRIEVDHEKTDVFRERAQYSKAFKARLAQARAEGKDAVRAVAEAPELRNAHEVETGILVDLVLSYRDMKAHAEMIALYRRLPAPLQRIPMMREQHAFALNREGRHDEAERVLHRPGQGARASSETHGLLGRVYKDRWDRRKAAGDARGRAASCGSPSRRTPRASRPTGAILSGVNAVTLMELQDRPTRARARCCRSCVRGAPARPTAGRDYWDHATLIELAVLANDRDAASEALDSALASRPVA